MRRVSICPPFFFPCHNGFGVFAAAVWERGLVDFELCDGNVSKRFDVCRFKRSGVGLKGRFWRIKRPIVRDLAPAAALFAAVRPLFLLYASGKGPFVSRRPSANDEISGIN